MGVFLGGGGVRNMKGGGEGAGDLLMSLSIDSYLRITSAFEGDIIFLKWVAS